MRDGHGSGLAAGLFALVISVALAAAGMAHRLPTLADRGGTADLAAYLAVGGSAADICGAHDGPGTAPGDCPACRMPGLAPQPARVMPPAARVLAVLAAPPAPEVPPMVARHPAWNGRAPPLV